MDDDNSVGSKRSRRSVVVSQGKRLTAKSLRLIQRGVSGLSAMSGDKSTLQSFSFETDEFGDDDDDDALSVIDMDFWIIPNGWEEYFDPDSQSTYYLNTITQVGLRLCFINAMKNGSDAVLCLLNPLKTRTVL